MREKVKTSDSLYDDWANKILDYLAGGKSVEEAADFFKTTVRAVEIVVHQGLQGRSK